jgi:hypothetical protein
VAKDSAVTIRLSSELLREAEELLPKLKADPRYRTLPRLTRASVLRLALDQGLHQLRIHLDSADLFTASPGFDTLDRRATKDG